MLRRVLALLGFVGIVLLLLVYNNSLSRAQAPLRLTFLDIGQGDAALIMDGNGFEILIDGGKPDAGPTVVAFLRQQGIDHLEVMLASHADADHIGGLITVLQATDITVGEVYYNGYEGSTVTWGNFGTAVANDGLTMQPAQFPQQFTWGDTTAHILHPAPGLVNPETNDASVVILMVHGQNRFLFTGDIDTRIEATVVARGTPIASQILKVAHHGSASSSSAAFLAAAGAEQAVISVALDNDYGHPADDTLSRLAGAGANIMRTDLEGTIFVLSDGITYTIFNSLPQEGRIFLPVVVNAGEPEPLTTGNIVISSILFDGVLDKEPDEYVEIRNDDAHTVLIRGWTLRDNASTTYTFPDFEMLPGQVCRIYTNQVHGEWCGFTYGSGSAIWNNGGDCAFLQDSNGTLAAQSCYP